MLSDGLGVCLFPSSERVAQRSLPSSQGIRRKELLKLIFRKRAAHLYLTFLEPDVAFCSPDEGHIFMSGEKRQGSIGLPGIKANYWRLSESVAGHQK